MKIKQIVVSQWEKFEELIAANREKYAWDNSGKRTPWIYRGNTDFECDVIRSSIERFFDREKVGGGGVEGALEIELIREFKRAYHLYSIHRPEPEANIEWLSLMQHYGAPTRLVDFTYSPYIAAYFTVEEKRSHYSVWGINSSWVFRESRAAISRERKKIDWRLLESPATENKKIFKAQNRAFFREPFVSSACTQNPYALNERLRIQKGVFVVHGNLKTKFMENLNSLKDCDLRCNAFKVKFPVDAKFRREVLDRLHHMGINRASLFPGLDGYAKSLGTFSPRLEEIIREKNKKST